MAIQDVKDYIIQYIKENNTRDITGSKMQSALLRMCDEIGTIQSGTGYVYSSGTTNTTNNFKLTFTGSYPHTLLENNSNTTIQLGNNTSSTLANIKVLSSNGEMSIDGDLLKLVYKGKNAFRATETTTTINSGSDVRDVVINGNNIQLLGGQSVNIGVNYTTAWSFNTTKELLPSSNETHKLGNGNYKLLDVNTQRVNGMVIKSNRITSAPTDDTFVTNMIGNLWLDGVVPFRSETSLGSGAIQQYGASLFWKTGDTHAFISANPFNQEVNITAGSNSTPLNWTRTLAFTLNNTSITATAFHESSLREYKENIQPFNQSALKLISGLDIVTYDRKDDGQKDKIGVIADDTSSEFLNEEKNAVDLYKTIFVMAKAIQELKAEIDDLKSK